MHMEQNINLINKSESTEKKHFNDYKAFIEYFNDMDIYKNIKECNPNKNRKILIVFDDMIGDMLSDKNFNPVVTELFIKILKIYRNFHTRKFGEIMVFHAMLTIKTLTLCLNLINRVPLFMNLRKSCLLECKLFYN